MTIPAVGRRIADDVIDFAQGNNVTQIVIGKSTRSRWFEMTRGSVVMIWSAAPAISAFTSFPVTSSQASRRRRRRCRPRHDPSRSMHVPI